MESGTFDHDKRPRIVPHTADGAPEIWVDGHCVMKFDKVTALYWMHILMAWIWNVLWVEKGPNNTSLRND